MQNRPPQLRGRQELPAPQITGWTELELRKNRLIHQKKVFDTKMDQKIEAITGLGCKSPGLS